MCAVPAHVYAQLLVSEQSEDTFRMSSVPLLKVELKHGTFSYLSSVYVLLLNRSILTIHFSHITMVTVDIEFVKKKICLYTYYKYMFINGKYNIHGNLHITEYIMLNGTCDLKQDVGKNRF